MKRTSRHLLLAALIATSGGFALAQTPPPAAPASAAAHAARMQQRMAEQHAHRLVDLKARLKITPAQEGAWATYATALQPPARPPQQRGEFEKLTTPQRIDLMQQRQAERATRMQQFGDATKAFYAQLSPEQQKTFDDVARRHGPREGRGPARDDHRRGPGHGAGPR